MLIKKNIIEENVDTYCVKRKRKWFWGKDYELLAKNGNSYLLTEKEIKNYLYNQLVNIRNVEISPKGKIVFKKVDSEELLQFFDLRNPKNKSTIVKEA